MIELIDLWNRVIKKNLVISTIQTVIEENIRLFR